MKYTESEFKELIKSNLAALIISSPGAPLERLVEEAIESAALVTGYMNSANKSDEGEGEGGRA